MLSSSTATLFFFQFVSADSDAHANWRNTFGRVQASTRADKRSHEKPKNDSRVQKSCGEFRQRK